MKSYKQFISEAREAKAFLAGDLPITKRKKKKVGQKVISKRKSNDLLCRGNESDVSVSSASSQEVDNSDLIHVGGELYGTSRLLRVSQRRGRCDEPSLSNP